MSESLLPYNKKYITKGNGFVNLGATCYFNSILQCLISCTSIFETLDKNRNVPHVKNNPLAMQLLKLYETASADQDISRVGIPVWRYVLGIAQRRRDNVKIDLGQQDAHEGMMMLLDVLDTLPEIKHLFEHRHRTRILCDACKKWVVDKFETNLTFEVQPDLKTEQHIKFHAVDEHYNKSMPLNEFLRKQNGFVDKDYICPNEDCKQRGQKFKTTTLTMVPEILPVLIKKYSCKSMTPFPGKLQFLSEQGTKEIIYHLVAQSEHSGGMGGGHYWAVALRSDGWMMLNDNSVSPGQPGPTLNSYVLFYHYIKTIDLTHKITIPSEASAYSLSSTVVDTYPLTDA
jgi:ubiquitin C-terminal hydrolase